MFGALQIFLNKERQVVPLKEKIQLSHDTFLYRFALPQENSVLGLPVGKHFKIFSPNAVGSVKGQWNGQPVRCDECEWQLPRCKMLLIPYL